MDIKVKLYTDLLHLIEAGRGPLSVEKQGNLSLFIDELVSAFGKEFVCEYFDSERVRSFAQLIVGLEFAPSVPEPAVRKGFQALIKQIMEDYHSLMLHPLYKSWLNDTIREKGESLALGFSELDNRISKSWNGGLVGRNTFQLYSLSGLFEFFKKMRKYYPGSGPKGKTAVFFVSLASSIGGDKLSEEVILKALKK